MARKKKIFTSTVDGVKSYFSGKGKARVYLFAYNPKIVEVRKIADDLFELTIKD